MAGFLGLEMAVAWRDMKRPDGRLGQALRFVDPRNIVQAADRGQRPRARPPTQH
jgi:hypothetical protein